MALVQTKSGGKPAKRTPARSKTSAAPAASSSSKKTKAGWDDLELPTEKAEPIYDLATSTIFIHGEAGIGKTDFASQFEDALNLAFEPSGRYLEIYRLPEVGSFAHWTQFVKVVDKLVKTDRFKNVVFDTADIAYDLCAQWVCEEHGEDHINEGDLGYGKGVDFVDTEFKRQILRLTSTGRGVIFISHTKTQEFERATGVKKAKLIPTIRDRGRRFINGFVDVTVCYTYDGNDRVLIIRGNEDVDAKCRIKGRFMTPKGEQVISIPAGDSAEEAYENFIDAYENRQTEPGAIGRRVGLSEVKARFGNKKKR